MQSIAVIGSGYWGKNLVRIFSQLGVLGCVCDTDHAPGWTRCGSPARRRASRPGSPTCWPTRASRRWLWRPLPSRTASVVRQCLEAGKDVFVEKPLALDAEDGQRLVALAAQRSRILMVGHILLYHPAVVKLRELINQGALGRILYCYSNRLNMGLIRTEENILWSFAPHDISVMLYLLGEEPIFTEAEGQSYLTPGVVDVTLSRLRFRSGVTGHIFVSWLHPSKEQKLVVVGSEQMAVFDDTAEKKLLLYPHRVDWASRTPKAVKAEAVAVELEKAEPLKQECLHFLDCVASRRTPLSDGQEGLRVLESARRLPAVAGEGGRRRLAAGRRGSGRSRPDDFFAHESALCRPALHDRQGHPDLALFARHEGRTIGENCSLGQNVVVGSAAVIGNGVKIQNNVSIYDAVTIEDAVFCGPSMVFTNVNNPRSEIVRKDEYRPTLIRRALRWAPTRRSSAAIPWAATPSSRPARWWPATCRILR